jgi:hypothetical protein
VAEVLGDIVMVPVLVQVEEQAEDIYQVYQEKHLEGILQLYPQLPEPCPQELQLM